jgi:hypothetical protein
MIKLKNPPIGGFFCYSKPLILFIFSDTFLDSFIPKKFTNESPIAEINGSLSNSTSLVPEETLFDSVDADDGVEVVFEICT